MVCCARSASLSKAWLAFQLACRQYIEASVRVNEVGKRDEWQQEMHECQDMAPHRSPGTCREGTVPRVPLPLIKRGKIGGEARVPEVDPVGFPPIMEGHRLSLLT